MKHLKIYSLATALILSAVSFAQVGEDVTNLLSDPTMESVANWANDNFKDNHRNAVYPLFNGYFIEAWSGSSATSETYLGTRSLTDTLRNIPNGTYLFTSAVLACQQSGLIETVSDAFIFANDEQVAVSTANNVPERFYVMTSVADGQLVVGFKTVETDANWMAVDNAKLFYYADGATYENAVASLQLKDVYDNAVTFPDTLPMQQQALAELKASLEEAAALLEAASPAIESVNAACENITAKLEAANASVEAYQSVAEAIDAAMAVYETYAEVSEVSEELGTLLTIIDQVQTAYNEMKAGVEEMEEHKNTLSNASDVLEVAVLYYDISDELNEILANCEAGTSYGTYPQSQMDKIIALQQSNDQMFESYQAGDINATQMLESLKEAQAIIKHFYESMILIDFSMPLNFSMWPYDETDEVVADNHESDFSCSDPDSPWAFGGRDNYNDTLSIWNADDNSYGMPATEKASADYNGWSDSYSSGWFFLQSNGVFQPRGTAATSTSPSVIFTAPESAIYFVKAVVSSNDSKRTQGAYDANNTQLGAYFMQKDDAAMHRIGETAPYWYGQPAEQNFYVNLQKGDRVVVSLGETVSDGHGGAQVDTLYVLGSKDEETGYSLDEAKNSGLLFYNAYVPADNWADLEAAIEAARQTISDNEPNMGEGLGQIPETAFADLDALILSGDRMVHAAVASQPDVDALASAIQKGIASFANSANSGICLGTEEAPSDSTLFVNHVFLPDSLYYIIDTATGLYMTAPEAGDKAAVYFTELMDENLSMQNCQVWHFNWMDTLNCYGIGSHANSGEDVTWTLDQELAAGDEAVENGFYHISENAARYGTSWFVVNRYDEALWRGQRVYFNGTNYTIIAGRNQGFNTVWSVDTNNKLTFSAGAARNFCFDIKKFDPTLNADSQTLGLLPVSRTYYNIQGMQVGNPEGLTIERTLWSDGTVTTKKVLRK